MDDLFRKYDTAYSNWKLSREHKRVPVSNFTGPMSLAVTYLHYYLHDNPELHNKVTKQLPEEVFEESAAPAAGGDKKRAAAAAETETDNQKRTRRQQSELSKLSESMKESSDTQLEVSQAQLGVAKDFNHIHLTENRYKNLIIEEGIKGEELKEMKERKDRLKEHLRALRTQNRKAKAAAGSQGTSASMQQDREDLESDIKEVEEEIKGKKQELQVVKDKKEALSALMSAPGSTSASAASAAAPAGSIPTNITTQQQLDRPCSSFPF